MIDKYERSLEFTLYASNLQAWEVVMHTSPADYHYREEVKGKRVYNKFAGFTSIGIYAIMKMLKVKKTAKILRKVRLIEYGAMSNV